MKSTDKDRNRTTDSADVKDDFYSDHEYDTQRSTEIEQPAPSIGTPTFPAEMPPR
jgi:hypothetical protein